MPLSARILFFLMRTYHAQIVSNKLMRTSISRLRTTLRGALAKNKALIGYNCQGIKYLQRLAQERKQSQLGIFDDDRPARPLPGQNSAAKRKSSLA